VRGAFVSYASGNRTAAEMVRSTLEAASLDCWIAPRDIAPGTTWAEAILDGIDDSRAMVVVFSTESNRSSHVLREVERAVAKRVPLVLFRIEACEPSRALEYFLSAQQWLDGFPGPTEAQLGVLVDAVKRVAASDDALELESAKVLVEAAEAGDAAAATTLGLRALERNDLEEAERWFRQGADGDDALAATNAGLLARQRGDRDEARQYLLRGAEGGDIMAATTLGLLQKEDENLVDAENWLRVGAEGGDIMAATALGMLAQQHGRRREAVEWLERGAAGGDRLAVEQLAQMASDDT
jgi:tetratricopeptide (TPR) repeat protein